MSLIESARLGKLPAEQYMDRETLDWIKDNKPNFDPFYGSFPKISKNDIALLIKYTPCSDWFFNYKKIDTIHGLRHILRVAIYAALLCEKMAAAQKTNIIISAMLHDIRRLEDKEDPGHGERSSSWFLSNIKAVEKQFKLKLEGKDIEEISTAVKLHEIPCNLLEKENFYIKHRYITDILKTADALDRYRLPKIKWWIDEKRLAIAPSCGIKKTAYDLVLSSESLYLDGKDNIESIFQSLKPLN
ncbi:MAG: HD domain-containing protein [Candidatus Paceibacterota bacterium]|jgi:hypothetical protein